MNPRQRCVLSAAAFLVALITGIAICSSCSPRRPLKEQIQKELDSLHAQYRFPGATAACILPDGTVEAFAVGLADIEHNIPMTPQSRMLAASIGKTFTGATILALAQENLLSLDDPVSKWLGDRPWYSRLPNHEEITIRHLLNHTSGIPDHVESEDFARAFGRDAELQNEPMPPEKLISFTWDRQPLFKAGEGWSYTDTGYILLGLIIEKITGRSYYEEVKRRFLEPWHLDLTSPSDRRELSGLASGYMAAENRFGLPARTTIRPEVMAWHPGIEWTGGGFVSNPRDLVVWGKNLFEGRAVKGRYLDDLLKSVQISEDDSLTLYGTAVAVKKGGPYGTVYGHGGWIPGYSSSLRYYPDYGVCIAFQINTDIGIVDHSTAIIDDMENRLAEIVINAVRHRK